MSGNVELRLGYQEERAAELEQQVMKLLAPFRGDERALDSGCGAGALAFAFAPHVAEVIGVDGSPELLAAGRELAPANVTLVEGDATALPFEYGEFALAGTLRVLHHVRRPELVVAEMVRVTRRDGRILIVDQLGDVDPLQSLEQDRFERARDPSHTRLLSDADIRGMLDSNGLVTARNEVTREERDLERYLDLVGLAGEERRRVANLAPGGTYRVDIGWYVAHKP
jgi:SAM-dependent methyltransferase